jgi:hypothetical protein
VGDRPCLTRGKAQLRRHRDARSPLGHSLTTTTAGGSRRHRPDLRPEARPALTRTLLARGGLRNGEGAQGHSAVIRVGVGAFSRRGCRDAAHEAGIWHLPHYPATGKGREHGRPSSGVHRGTLASFH